MNVKQAFTTIADEITNRMGPLSAPSNDVEEINIHCSSMPMERSKSGCC